MNQPRLGFLVSLAFALLAAAVAITFVELLFLGLLADDGPTDMGAAPVVAVVWLAILWFGRGQLGWSIAIVLTGLASAATAGVLLVAVSSPAMRLVVAGVAGAATALLHAVIQNYAHRTRASVLLPAIAAVAGLVTATDTGRLFREADAPTWVLIGLSGGLVTLAGLLIVDGLGGERGRLRTPGFVVLGICSVLGLLGLLL